MNHDEAYGKACLLAFVIFPILIGMVVGFGFLLKWIFEILNIPYWVLIFFA